MKIRLLVYCIVAIAFLGLGFQFISYGASAQPPQGDFVDLAERLLPVVVDVSVKNASSSRSDSSMPRGLPEDHPFRRFFEPFEKDNLPPLPSPQALGSGFIIDKRGVIVTNEHVVSGAGDSADSITVSLSDGRKFNARIVGTDSLSDIAVLRIVNSEVLDLPVARFGDPKQVKIGQWVLAIGRPFGLKGSVTAGIVSAVNRDIGKGMYDDFIQTDAAINRGNSGGPLFNREGEVIGINTVILSPTGGSSGVGFAIPISTARPVISQLLESGKTSRGWLGVQIQEVDENLAASLGLDRARGALVAEVIADSPAGKAGIKQGDVIVRFNGEEVEQMRQLPRLVSRTAVGSRAVVEVIRDTRLRRFSLMLGRLETELARQQPPKRRSPSEESAGIYGMVLSSVSPQLRRTKNIPEEVKGVWVSEVKARSPAWESSVNPGSVIMEVDRKPVRSAKNVERLIRAAERAGKKAVLLRVWHQGTTRFIALVLK